MMPMQNVFAQRAGMPQAGGSGGMQPPATPPQMPMQGQAPMRPGGFDPRMGGMPGGIQAGGPPMSGPVQMQGAPMQAQPIQQAQVPVQAQPPQNFLRQRLMAM
jgi:hypothetical protein